VTEADDQADDRDDARRVGVEAVTDELRHRELAELAQVRRQQQRQEHVAAGPAHEKHGAAVAAVKAISPAMEMNEAADIQSAAVAMPFCTGWIPAAGDVEVPVDPARAQMAMPMYRAKVKPTTM
jgi:hypothetical protein